MPSKLLIAAAEAAHHARRAGEFGLHLEGLRVDGAAVMRRVRQERDRFAGAVVRDTEALPGKNRLCGQARFLDAETLEVVPLEGDDPPVSVKFTAVVLATGSSPMVPPAFDDVRQRVLTSQSIFELEDLPRSLAVVGTGVVGLELGQAVARLGSDVTFLDRSEHPGPFTDPEVLACVHQVLPRELRLNMSSDVVAAREEGDGVRIDWRSSDGREDSQVFEAVLVAAGRPPNLSALNLAATGLPLDDKGMPPWNRQTGQCGELPIFLAGDANGHKPLLHEAGDEGRISGGNAAAWPNVEEHSRRAGLTVLFCDPQMAMAGTAYSQLDDDVSIGQATFDDQGRARVMAVNRGIIRVYARRRDCVLVGAEMFGPRMEHMAHLLAWAIQEQTPVQHLLQMPVYHPTLEEGMRSALRDLARELKVEGECRRQDMTTAPGT